MDHQTLIFDISSDEEFSFDNNSSTAEDLDWIAKLLDDVPTEAIDQKIADSNKINNDVDDDVVVVGEVIVKPKRVKRAFPMVNNDDDDCVVLEFDPDKPPPSKLADNEVKNFDADGETDDLVVVGENGQVACRDFPHSRHLCANFPFSSTSHENRCDQCHCYVCDSLAPCPFWGSGASTTDHCHATDKAGYWQTERRKVRQLKNPSLPTSKPVVSLAQSSQPVQPYPHPCSHPRVASAPFGVPNIVNQGRSQRPYVTVARNGYQRYLVSQQLLRACDSDTQGNRVPQVAPRMTLSRPIFKRHGFTTRSGVPNRAVYCSPDNVSVAFSQPQQLAAKTIENSSANLHGSSPQLVMNPNLNRSNTRTLPSHLPGYGLSDCHAPTSRFQGCGQPAAVVSDNRFKNSSIPQAQSISSPLIPCNTSSSALNKASQSSQQHSVETQNFLCPSSDLPSNITQRSHQTSGVAQYCSSNPCSTLIAPNIVVQNSIVEVKMGIDESLPPLEKDSQTALDFDVDSWLEGTVGDGSFFDMSSQASQTCPIDTGTLRDTGIL